MVSWDLPTVSEGLRVEGFSRSAGARAPSGSFVPSGTTERLRGWMSSGAFTELPIPSARFSADAPTASNYYGSEEPLRAPSVTEPALVHPQSSSASRWRPRLQGEESLARLWPPHAMPYILYVEDDEYELPALASLQACFAKPTLRRSEARRMGSVGGLRTGSFHDTRRGASSCQEVGHCEEYGVRSTQCPTVGRADGRPAGSGRFLLAVMGSTFGRCDATRG